MTADTQAETEALKPCPFCGGNSIRAIHVRDGRKVGCERCGATCGAQFHGRVDDIDAHTRAIAAWNTRAQPKPEVAPDTRIKTTVVATYEDLRWQLHTIAGHLRGMNRWKEAKRVQAASYAMYPKGAILPQPMIPRSHHG